MRHPPAVQIIIDAASGKNGSISSYTALSMTACARFTFRTSFGPYSGSRSISLRYIFFASFQKVSGSLIPRTGSDAFTAPPMTDHMTFITTPSFFTSIIRLVTTAVKPPIELLVQLTHLTRRFHRMPIHEPFPEGTLINQTEDPPHKRYGQYPERLHFPRGQPDFPSRDCIQVIPDLLCGLSHECDIFSRVLGIRRLIISIGDRHDHGQMAQLPGVHVQYDLIRNLRPAENPGKFSFSSIFFPKGRRLDKPRRQGCVQHTSVETASGAGKGGNDPPCPADCLPFVTGFK